MIPQIPPTQDKDNRPASYRQTWLIAYDIRNAARLRRVHKYLSNLGHALQYSLFVADLSADELDELKQEMQSRADADHDDVRLYCLSQTSRGNWIGPGPGNDNVSIYDSPSGNFVKNLVANPLEPN